MGPVLVVVADVLAHQTFQMPLVEHYYIAKQVTSAITYPAFGNAVLPWASEAGSLRLDARDCYGADNFPVEVRGSVEIQIARRRIIWECPAKMLRYPLAARMTGHAAVENAPPVMRDDEETVEHAEGQRRHGKEIHRGDRLSVVAQKGLPTVAPAQDCLSIAV